MNFHAFVPHLCACGNKVMIAFITMQPGLRALQMCSSEASISQDIDINRHISCKDISLYMTIQVYFLLVKFTSHFTVQADCRVV